MSHEARKGSASYWGLWWRGVHPGDVSRGTHASKEARGTLESHEADDTLAGMEAHQTRAGEEGGTGGPRGEGGWTARRVLYAVLGLQLGMAVLLAGSDILRALPGLVQPSTAPGFDSPVAPGDQTRRFAPRDTPLPDRAPGAPQRPFENTGDMPSRLEIIREAGILRLTGAIERGDEARVAERLGIEEGLEEVHLNSPGGSVHDALGIGRYIREAGLDTRVGAGDICFSACPYMLAAGIRRSVNDDAQVGVHQHYFGENTVLPAFLAVEDIQRGQAEVMDFLDRMGVDVRLMGPALATGPDDIYVLLPEELRDYRLVTDGEPDGDPDTAAE